MAIIISNDGNKDVATIAARDALSYKFNGMEVVVMDAIADPQTGGGMAAYKWKSSNSTWEIMWKNSSDNLTFITESKTLSGGIAVASHAPQDGIVWGAVVINELGIIVGDFSPTVTGTSVNIGTTSFDGLTLSMTYGYGTIQAAVSLSMAQNRFFTGNFTGTLTPTVSTARWYPPANITLSSVYASVGEAPTGSSVIIDILKNGTSIFSGSKPTITVGTFKSSTIAVTTAVTTTDYLTLSILQADSGVNLTTFVAYTTS